MSSWLSIFSSISAVIFLCPAGSGWIFDMLCDFFSIKSMIISIMILTAQWYFFVKTIAILCYFCSTYAYSCCLYSIYAYNSLWFLLYLFLYIKYSNIWKITNIFVKQYKKSKRACPDLEPLEFCRPDWPAGLAFLTGPNRLVEILDLTGKKPVSSNTELNWRETGSFNISKRVFHKFWSHFNFFFLSLPYSIV